MTRKIEQAERAEPPLESIVKSARELNCGERLLTPREAADFLRVSTSWLAKARMRGDGPPYAKLGRSIRYREGALAAVAQISCAPVDQRAVAAKLPEVRRVPSSSQVFALNSE